MNLFQKKRKEKEKEKKKEKKFDQKIRSKNSITGGDQIKKIKKKTIHTHTKEEKREKEKERENYSLPYNNVNNGNLTDHTVSISQMVDTNSLNVNNDLHLTSSTVAFPRQHADNNFNNET